MTIESHNASQPHILGNDGALSTTTPSSAGGSFGISQRTLAKDAGDEKTTTAVGDEVLEALKFLDTKGMMLIDRKHMGGGVAIIKAICTMTAAFWDMMRKNKRLQKATNRRALAPTDSGACSGSVPRVNEASRCKRGARDAQMDIEDIQATRKKAKRGKKKGQNGLSQLHQRCDSSFSGSRSYR